MAEKERNQDTTWGMLCHLAALSMFIGVPFGHIIGPLIIWLIKRDEMPFVNEQGREALNFQISMTIYYFIAGIMILVVIGVVLLPVLLIGHLVLIIIASVRASEGVSYSYPFTIRFLN